jgi:hypothetical protein
MSGSSRVQSFLFAAKTTVAKGWYRRDALLQLISFGHFIFFPLVARAFYPVYGCQRAGKHVIWSNVLLLPGRIRFELILAAS